ncbi:MAG: glycoside hydrolase family 99-like domain-containing protein [Oscillospiraceae bacterium]|nr:glycoside hydrolase family 99-like domain-containing protein [Oscillospiraceae bacterium]
MKTIAFYLPQFHTIPENDAWWGEGFTEWVNVKNAKPQFKGHSQPEVPLGNNYYNLLNPDVQVKQAQLAQEYGVGGFCYYHYWFEGKLLLEKPMENMLSNNSVDIPFCICWANETWARTWDGQEKQVLMKQNYNEDREAWKAHFEYLLPFFKDSRYILHDGKPMMLIYKPHLITNCREMIGYWRELAIDAGFKGIYFGYQHPSAFDADCSELGFDFGIEFEPFYTVREIHSEISSCGKPLYAIRNPKWFWTKLKRKLLNLPVIYDYDDIWTRILNRTPEKDGVIPGAFPAWDNTPRRGNKSNVFYQATPEKFKRYFAKRVQRAKDIYNAPYLFINAWNEWAEGAHLEPDTVNGYGYLEAFKRGL